MKRIAVQCWDGDGVIPPEELERRRAEAERIANEIKAKEQAKADRERVREEAKRELKRQAEAMRLRRQKAAQAKKPWSWSVRCTRFTPRLNKDGVSGVLTVCAPEHRLNQGLKKKHGAIGAEHMIEMLISLRFGDLLMEHTVWKKLSLIYSGTGELAIPVEWVLHQPVFTRVRHTAPQVWDITFTCKRIENVKHTKQLPEFLDAYDALMDRY